MDADSQERISIYMQVLSNPTEEMQQLCLVHCRAAFSTMLAERLATEAANAPQEPSAMEINRQADDLISVRQLKGKARMTRRRLSSRTMTTRSRRRRALCRSRTSRSV